MTGRSSLTVPGSTAEEVVFNLLHEIPGLRVHLFDEAGDLRPHVICFVDGTATRLEDRSSLVQDEMIFLQAVSGRSRLGVGTDCT